MSRRLAALLLPALVAAGCHTNSAPVTPPQAARPTPVPRPALTPGAERWVEKTLAGLSLERKAAQLVFVRMNGYYQSPRAVDSRELLERVRELGVGGVVVFDSEVDSLPRLLNGLQRASAVPLLVAADLERGLSFRVRRGVVPLPYAMAVGATRSEEAARFCGRVAAREARAVGIHWTFAPVADVNNNPANPVINIRSFGEDPHLVARLAAAWVGGAHEGGLLTTAKHFPGHGDTAVDSHLALATLAGDRARLDSVELRPFRELLAAGVDAVMLGHIAVPALDASGSPATLSAPVAEQLLRRELGFGGLVVTDALDMAGVKPAWDGEAVVRAVQAGADVVLMPLDARVAVQALARAVREGQLTEARLDQSVRRVLQAKARQGLDHQRLVDPAAVAAEVGRPEDVAQALEVARASITVARNEGGLLPLRAERPLRLLHLLLSSDARNPLILGYPEAELAARRIEAETRFVGPELSPGTADELVARSAGFSHVLVSAFVAVRANKGTADMIPPQADLIRRLQEAGRPVIVVSYGSPYLLEQFPGVPAYVCAYGAAESSQRAAVAALFGEFDVRGQLPVSLPGLYPLGHGLQLPRQAMTLSPAQPAEAGLTPEGLAALDQLLRRAVEQKAFPGGVVAVARRGRLAHLQAFGRLSYDADAAPVTTETLYDLASLTKVVATTTLAMTLVDDGRLDLDKRVVDFLPRFRGDGRERVTVRQLLTHSSGLPAWLPLNLELKGPAAYLERLEKTPLEYEPGTKSVYSDLGLILLGEVLARVGGRPFERLVQARVLDPLGLRSTLYRPGPELLPRVAPTENDPWRGRVLRGEVHDENAFALGGVAPHAGLFSTAPDLARFAQMLLNGGVLEHRRVVSRRTLELFTRRLEPAGSTRALGWDTPGEGSWSSPLMSARAFGHTGFTGTSLWVDPERELFMVLLTNRVHPSRENKAILAVRREAAEAVFRSLAD